MTILIGQIVGCLLVAAGIGGIIGWLLRHLSVSKLNQHIYDVTTDPAYQRTGAALGPAGADGQGRDDPDQ